MLSQDDQTTLNDIRYHWQDVYFVNFADGVWAAVPFDDRTVLLTADTGMELRDKIRYDYTERAVQRQARVLADAGGWISGPSIDAGRDRAHWPVGNSGP
jgi:hypothetical protein